MDSSLRPLTGTALLALLSWGCAVKLPFQRPPATAFKVPPGCEGPLGGLYHHAQDPGFRYQAVDDGLKLELSLLTHSPSAPGREPPHVTLNRTSDGFRGETRAVGQAGDGRTCPLVFPTELVACEREGLTLRTVRATSIDDRCEPVPATTPEWTEHRLVREETP